MASTNSSRPDGSLQAYLEASSASASSASNLTLTPEPNAVPLRVRQA